MIKTCQQAKLGVGSEEKLERSIQFHDTTTAAECRGLNCRLGTEQHRVCNGSEQRSHVIPNSHSAMSLDIRLTEAVVFLRTVDTAARRPLPNPDAPSVVRGLLTLDLPKPTRISSIELELVAKTNNNWSEGPSHPTAPCPGPLTFPRRRFASVRGHRGPQSVCCQNGLFRSGIDPIIPSHLFPRSWCLPPRRGPPRLAPTPRRRRR